MGLEVVDGAWMWAWPLLKPWLSLPLSHWFQLPPAVIVCRNVFSRQIVLVSDRSEEPYEAVCCAAVGCGWFHVSRSATLCDRCLDGLWRRLMTDDWPVWIYRYRCYLQFLQIIATGVVNDDSASIRLAIHWVGYYIGQLSGYTTESFACKLIVSEVSTFDMRRIAFSMLLMGIVIWCSEKILKWFDAGRKCPSGEQELGI